eukprot:897253-Pleurochrysis_carterae.AAC.1
MSRCTLDAKMTISQSLEELLTKFIVIFASSVQLEAFTSSETLLHIVIGLGDYTSCSDSPMRSMKKQPASAHTKGAPKRALDHGSISISSLPSCVQSRRSDEIAMARCCCARPCVGEGDTQRRQGKGVILGNGNGQREPELCRNAAAASWRLGECSAEPVSRTM